MKLLYTLLTIILISVQLEAETYVYFQNNTQYAATITNTPSANLSGDWTQLHSGNFDPWRLQTRLYQVNRNTGISNGQTHYLTTTVSILGSSVSLQLRLDGSLFGSSMYQSSNGPGFDDPWFSDNDVFHSNTFTIAGKQFILKYRADLPPGNIYDDLYYVLQEVDPYPQSPSDLADPDIFNVLAYNIFMLTPPIGSSDEADRASIMSNYVKGYDAIVFSEAFYNSARATLLNNLAAEYPYQTSVVDQAGSIEDGGVLIVSRWPIEEENHIAYNECDGSDCLAAKGAKYARINKLGKKYHLFGTHTQAFTDPENRVTRQMQFTQMRNWMDAKNIPSNEPIIIGGDLNVDKLANADNEYNIMHQILKTKPTNVLGDNFTTNQSINTYGSGPTEYLDYVLVDTTHFSPAIQTNRTQILRHAESIDDLWDNNDLELDLSDHFAVHGRFVYPRIDQQPMPQTLCEGSSISLSVTTNVAMNYQWQKNGVDISGATSNTYDKNNATLADAGDYKCVITYDCGAIMTNSTAVTVVTGDSVTIEMQSCESADTASVTLQNQNGCDSVVTTITTLLPSDSVTIQAQSCEPADTGTASVTLQNQYGCDSVVTTITTLSPSDAVTIQAQSCESADTGIASVILQNQYGCDSIVTTITTLLTSDAVTIEAQSCEPADTGTASVILQNQYGCDSVVTTITTLYPQVNVTFDDYPNGNICSDASPIDLSSLASPSGGSFSGNGVNNTEFDPATAGVGDHIITYSVTNEFGCSDTDSITLIVEVCTGLEQIQNLIQFDVYPNPAKDNVQLSILLNENKKVEVSLIDVTAKELFHKIIDNNSSFIQENINLSKFSAGTYFIVVKMDENIVSKQIIHIE